MPLPDPEFNISDETDMLIRTSVFWKLFQIGQVKLEERMPGMQNSLLGWIVCVEIGNFLTFRKANSRCYFNLDVQ